MSILVTGGLGFIGSHAAASLLGNERQIVILDNLCNSKASVHQNLEVLSQQKIPLYVGGVRDSDFLSTIFSKYDITALMHFAGLKSVAESVIDPLKYYENNVVGAVVLIWLMQKHGVYKIIFSLSATVYGAPKYLPFDESHPKNPINPYGSTKLQVEEILANLSKSDKRWAIAYLRYFNPVGAHPSGLIGELPNHRRDNLMPYIAQVAAKHRPFLMVYGDDCDIEEGTGERDNIHVMDLAEGHIAALELLENQPGLHVFNLGTDKPHSVFGVIRTLESVSGQSIPVEIGARRDGDLPSYYESPMKAKSVLGWQAKRTLEDICQSAWQFQLKLQTQS